MIVLSVVTRSAERGEREVDRFASWELALRRLREDLAAGRRPGPGDLPEYLRGVPEDQRAGVLEDLAAEHLAASWREGGGILLESYAPLLEDLPGELVEDEFLARHRLPHGDLPSIEEYERRFPDRPHLRRALKERLLGGGAYVKLRRIGSGGMGEVWEAVDRLRRTPVAIKTLHPGLSGDLAEEFRVTGGLDHPGIFRIEAVTAGFGVMRLAAGRSLTDRLREYHQPAVDRPAAEARALLRALLESFLAVCEAVSHAHARGVIHRDLKPGNIMIDDQGRAGILDWGLARRLSEAGPPLVAGTPDYMAPEQAAGISDVRTDIFGLGAVLYEILAGRPPHAWGPEGRPTDWEARVREARFVPPRPAQVPVPAGLSAVCLKALSGDPALRYPTAEELAGEVRRHLAGQPVRARPASAAARAWRWMRGVLALSS